MGQVNYVEVFRESFQRTVSPDPESFFQQFYDTFLSSSPQAREKFARTDMERQKRMLEESLVRLMEFFVGATSDDTMDHVADVHGRGGHAIDHALYGEWLDCLLSTVRDRDPRYDANVGLAWRVVLAPGIEFMKYRHPGF
jgi:hypothetical protein